MRRRKGKRAFIRKEKRGGAMREKEKKKRLRLTLKKKEEKEGLLQQKKTWGSW